MKAGKGFSGPGKRIVLLALAAALAAVFIPCSPALAAPTIAITPSSGSVGTVTTISGSVFDSYAGDTIYVFFNGNEIESSPFTMPDTGEFEIPFTVPAGTPSGMHQINVTMDQAGAWVIANTRFTVESTNVQMDIMQGPVGTSITISGTGFYAGSGVNIYFHNPSPVQVGTNTASGTGRFEHHYVIPPSTAGTHTITVTSLAGNQAGTSFKVVPAIALDRNSGGPGETVSLMGTGFGSVKQFTVTIGTKSVATGYTDELGNFNLEFYVPNLKANLYDLLVQDADNNQDTEKFTVTAGASLSSATGAVGSSLTVRGDGFAPGGTITISFGDAVMDTVTGNSNGGFVSTFSVPALGGGGHIVTINDGKTIKEFEYIIETDAPPAPVQVSPAEGAETGPRVTLDWEDVQDESLPVTYSLQVSSNGEFTILLIDETGLAVSEYSLNGIRQLPASDGPTAYYWRVSAADGAWNEGEWSAARSFIYNPPPAPVLMEVTAKKNSVKFAWEEMPADSGMSVFILEIAEDGTFSDPVVREEALTTTEFTIEDEAYLLLKDNTPYYWRVMATDGESNESGWSETGMFSTAAESSGFPAWAIFAIAGIGVIAIAYLGFRMKRRAAYDRYDD